VYDDIVTVTPDDQVPAAQPVATDRPSVWNVMVGAAVGARDAAALLASATRGASQRTWRSSDVAASVRTRLAVTAERGATARANGRRRIGEIVDELATSVATAPLVNRVVDAQVDRILRPVVRTVLDDVLELLEAEPERMQGVVRGQRETIVDELVDRVRAGAAAGDAVVDRWRDRVLRRAPSQVPTPVQVPAATL
jgi:hypothetical protein